jgi:uncharacterized protein (TIGR00106 family)
MAVVEVTVVPIGTGGASLSKYVASVMEPLEQSGLNHELTSMGTNIEGPLDRVLEVVRQMHERPFREGVLRVVTRLVIDDRRDKELSIEGKKRSVREKR